ncbi:MAG: lipid A deacylase LpxR family protein [Lentimicrobiaceae bacterium]|jgi:hypothetical protein|nr:lipid A deacylase LpxR family protein [Lentimicrobiaceae bacterium]
MVRLFGIGILIVTMFFTSCKSCSNSRDVVFKKFDKETIEHFDSITPIFPENSIFSDDTCKVDFKKNDLKNHKSKSQKTINCKKKSLVSTMQYKKTDTVINVLSIIETPKKRIIPFLPDFYGEALTSMNRYLLLRFDNDIFIEKDYYYTNGAMIGIIHPKLQHFFIHKTLLTLGNNSLNYNSLTINHEMFTPVDPEQTTIDFDDRPFCGTLFLEFGKISILKEKQLMLQSSLKLGVIGEISLASFFQSGIHNKAPTGWEFQIRNDIIINGLISVQKGFLSRRNIDFSGMIETSFGSYMTYLVASPKLKIGSFASSYDVFYTAKPNTIEKNSRKKIQYTFFIEPEIRYVIHNATLNGGFFNRNSPHKFKINEIKHLIFNGKIGITFFFEQHGISFCYTGTSPEFETRKYHGWGSINYIFNF